MPSSSDAPEILQRLSELEKRAQVLEAEGLPFPTAQLDQSIRQALDTGEFEHALTVVKRAETLYTTTSRDWTWVRELLRRADELRGLAQSIGVDLAHLDQRVGNARDQLKASSLSAGSLEKAAASASLALAVLADAIPKFCVQEGQRLGSTIRAARDRGEDVSDSTISFRAYLSSIQEEQLPLMVSRLLDVRRAVGRIPRAPAIATMPTDEEEDILLEARSLARRLGPS
ncbi:MAG: hypothetical protein L3J96_06050 [Thermoplasmata archaeon]|nr:hypothetical protein [Thermoplasmata archaeon]